MARRRMLKLSEEQQQALSELRDRTKEEAVRERCAALLKIANGVSAHQVAQQGLLRPRDPDTVYGWLDIYAAEGMAGLQAHRQGGKRRRGL
jgi:hypothetical protein